MAFDPRRAFLRHALATLAYRADKTFRDAPSGFAELRIGDGTRTPMELLAHLGDLLDWSYSIVVGEQKWEMATPVSWDVEVARFHAAIERLDRRLASDEPVNASIERLFQGPIADALTHVGQLAMIRRVAGAPVRGENYYAAPIEVEER